MGVTPFKEAAEPTAIARLFKRWAGNGPGRQAGWHALYQQACARHPGCWSGKTRNWEPIEAVMLNPDREQPALGGGGRKNTLDATATLINTACPAGLFRGRPIRGNGLTCAYALSKIGQEGVTVPRHPFQEVLP